MNPSVFDNLLMIFGASVVLTSLFARLQLPPFLGYLAAGVLLGPGALGVVGDVAQISGFAEFGIVFLLFTLGLEFSIPKMLALRKAVFLLGGLQVLLSAFPIYFLLSVWGVNFLGAVIVAATLALSSTTIVVKELMRCEEFNKHHGQVAFGVLLFQDLAAILFLVLIPALPELGTTDLTAVFGELLLHSAMLVALLFAIGHWVLPRVFHEVGKIHGDELLVLTALVVALLAGWLTHWFGLSMTLGAFLAGMTLGESHYRHQIEADIRPFRDILLGLFFVGIGATLDIQLFLAQWRELAIALLLLLTIKLALVTGLSRATGEPLSISLRLGFTLAHSGEFGFVLLTLAGAHGLLAEETQSFFTALIVLSMLCAPFMMRVGRYFADYWQRTESARLIHPEDDSLRLTGLMDGVSHHVVICGYGRVGQTVSRFLQRFEIPFVALDSDSVRVREAAHAGENVFYGDSKRPEMLKAAGLEEAKLVVISFGSHEQRLQTLRAVRAMREDVPVLVRIQDDSQLQYYLDEGASEVVPETLEASLMLVSHVLAMSGVSTGQIIRAITQTRQQRYKILQGYYQGLNTRLIDDEGRRLKILHAYSVTDESWASGRKIKDFKLNEIDVDISAIRRGENSEQTPSPDMQLLPGDIVILYGLPERIEQAEQRLIAGI